MSGPIDTNGLRDFTMFTQLMRVSWIIRLVGLLVFIGIAYFLSEITLRPAKKAHTEQRRFIANVSHELRTPLSVLKTSSEVALLRGKDLTRDEAIEVLKSNIEEVDRMSKIIQFFLNFSTAQHKIDHVQMSAVNLSQITSKAINILQKRAGEKGVTIRLVDRGAAVVYGNVTALEEMILNIIKNAITYTPKDGLVEVAIKHTFDEVLLSVRDTGLGIPADDLPHVFEPFFKASNTLDKKEGVGLGLAIVREIASMHRAQVEVKSKIGKGTTFFVHFRKR
jgi:two-component system phosphate regulon sensor histidine kinase PhoR